MSNTDENRFHALKFAAQTLGAAHPGDVIQAANLYLDFLEGRLATTAEQAEAEAQELAKDVELADLTHSYPADEPVIAMADSPMEAEQIVDELFGLEHPPAMTDAEAEAQGLPTNTDQLSDWLAAQPEPEMSPTLEAYAAEITAAVEQIADPAPVTEDASEQPEMTDEQVERTEDHWRAAADQIGEAEHEPEKELEPVGAHMRFAPWFATRK